MIEGFVREGVELNQTKKKKLKKVKKEIAELERKANKNLDEDKGRIEVAEYWLKGMTRSGIEKLQEVPGKKGYRYITMKR